MFNTDMQHKKRVGILFGGKSVEHEVSLRSAKNVIAFLDHELFEPVPIRIDKQGHWFLEKTQKEITLAPEHQGALIDVNSGAVEETVDVIFPVTHGIRGEDGTVQAALKLANVPFVGAGILGSAVGMDKDVMKRLLQQAGFSVPSFLTVREEAIPTYAEIVQKLGTTFFIKPANTGSSVGISKITREEDYLPAIREALQYDRKLIIEQGVLKAREIECAVLDGEPPVASLPGEVIPQHDFYSYRAKYLDKHGAILQAPAHLSPALVQRIQETAIRVFKTLECEGMGRVDFFLAPDETLFVNEINTLPGFTDISMYPKLLELTGVPPAQLITKLITLAFERFEREKQLKTSIV